MISCRVLGPVELTMDGVPAPAELLWRKNLALLVYLARSPKRTRSREHLVGLLWGEKPEALARHSLNEAVRILRKYAGEGAIEGEGDQLRLGPEAVELDTDQFDRLVAEADWRGAADLIAGEFMEGFYVPGSSEFENWLSAERLAWRERSVNALARSAEELLAGGHVREAADIAHRALALDPFSDVAARVAIRSIALSGDRAKALALYEAFTTRLADEVGIDPADETRALAERVGRERTWTLPEPALKAEREGEPSRRTPLVGRDMELTRLLQAWNACRTQARATLAVLEGDPGTGKTRLGEEMLVHARLDGGVAAAVRAVEADLESPWSGVLTVARIASLDEPGLRAAPPAALAGFAAHLPEWAERFQRQMRGAEPVPLVRACTDVLRAVTGVHPLLLFLDDAQWMDRDSLLTLASVLRDLESRPLFILVAAASHPPRAELDEFRTRIDRDIEGLALRLGPLSRDALRALARWALPRYSELDIDRVVRRIATDSAGLPLLAVELLHAVSLGLDLRGSHEAWPEPSRTLDQTLPGQLPDAVVAAVRIGFRRLSAAAQRALAAAAVLDDRVDPETLARATGLEPDALLAALDELEWQRWLSSEPRGYSFVARIVREVVARDMLTPGQRRRILKTVGRA